MGETVLLRGLGDCAFERANEAWGFDGGNGWTTAFAATWEGDDALPTLALGTYVDTATSNERIGNCGDNRLYRPNAAGTGYDAPIVLTPGFCALSMLFSDWNRDGQRDLRVSQRPPLRAVGRGAAVADDAGRGARAVHGGGRLAEAGHLGHGHRLESTSPATASRRST